MIGGNKLTVQRVPPQMAPILLAQSSHSTEDPLLNCPPSCILRLSNMVTNDDLTNDELYQELLVYYFFLSFIISFMFLFC